MKNQRRVNSSSSGDGHEEASKSKSETAKPESQQTDGAIFNKRLVDVGRRLFLAGIVVSTAGCKNFVERAQSPDNHVMKFYDQKKKSTKYIGDVVAIGGLDFAKVEGIGLAVGLQDTGSNPRPSGQREYLVHELEGKTEVDVEKVLDSKDTELVVMQGMLPPGIRKGEKFDIEVRVLPKTEATSLENGSVLQTRMKPNAILGNRVKQGHTVAMCKGGILVDALFETRKDHSNNLVGHILGGGVALKDRPLGLVLRSEDHPAKTTTLMARAINGRFTKVDNEGHRGVAEPKTDRNLVLELPEKYRHNVGRYIQVISNIAFSETSADRLARIEQLTAEIEDPAKTGLASLRLEALGQEGIPALKRALKHPDLEVKFYAAQALAYLGETDGVDHLKLVAESEPAFRWNALTALSSLDSSESKKALVDLMHVPSAETRYGAFRALQACDARNSLVSGQWLGDFFLHRIPSESDPMVHYSRSKRPEIVVFGDTQTVGDEFLHVEAGLTIRATGQGTVALVKYHVDGGESRKVCSNRVTDVIETLSKIGFSYGDLLKIFRKATTSGSLNSRLVVNAVPKLGRTYVPGSADEPAPEKSERFVSDQIPELFRDGNVESPVSAPSVSEAPSTTTSGSLQYPQRAKSKLSKLEDWLGGKKTK